MSAADAIEHSEHGDAVVVDARPQIMRHQGSLPGAMVVDPDEVVSVFAGVPRGLRAVGEDTEINVVSVSSQAPRIAEEIAALGYTNVHYVDGGFRALSAFVTR